MKTLFLAATLAILPFTGGTALAQSPSVAADAPRPPVDPALQQRVEQVVELINGTVEPKAVLIDAFLQAVPAPQLKAIATEWTEQYGKALSIETIDPAGPTRASFVLHMERAQARGSIAIESNAPHRITELLVQSFVPLDDGADKIAADLDALPGRTAAWFGPLGGDPIFAHGDPDAQFAIGSTFKLYVLAALSRAVEQGRLSWDTVVPLDRKSLPSGIMHDWPDGAPATVHTLATLMISRSDNTATDLLIDRIGRDAVAEELRASGHSDPARTLPFLKTMESFVLKSTGPGGDYAAADEAGQARILETLLQTDPDVAKIREVFAANTPMLIDSVEWFASMEDERRLLRVLTDPDWDAARAIMAVNPSLSPAQLADWSYVGYKGGSEPGVLNLTWLLRDEGGTWYMLALSWNDSSAALKESTLMLIAPRVLSLAD